VNDGSLFDWLCFPGTYLRAALAVSLLSVWVLVGLFCYLNFYTRRRYFNIWTAAWLFYALWLTLCLTMLGEVETPLVSMLKQFCVGTSAMFLLWGSARFLGQRTPQKLFGLFLGFLAVWSYISAYHFDDALQAQVPVFSLMGLASIWSSVCFFRFRRARKYIGAGLLSGGFILWGFYLISHPFLQRAEHLVSAGFYILAVLQLFIAVSMIILVLEEVRQRKLTVQEQIRTQISANTALQNKVQSTEDRYRKLFDQASEGIIITETEELRVLELNQTAKRFFGLAAPDGQSISLKSFIELPGSRPLPQSGPEWFAALSQRRQLQIVRRDGSKLAVEVSGAAIQFGGRPACQFFFREQTEQARLEQQLRQAEKLSALGQMISGVAHELNNPLAVIKGYLELILAKHELPPQTRADLEKVAHEGNRAAKLVSNFLSFARERPPQRVAVNLNALITEVAELRQFDLRVACTELQLQLDPGLPMVSADPDQVQQVLVNLLNNSLHALVEIPLPHRIRVRTETREKVLRLTIEDNGPGVPEELVSRIFEPFFTTKEVGTGTGLGLSIAHSIMADHHGRIYYRRTEGGDPAFVLEFPRTATAVPAMAPALVENPAPLETAPVSVKGASVLVLDDEKSIAEMLVEMLGLLGHRAQLSHAGPHALELIARQDFDVILSDFRMPLMDGREFYEAVRRQKPELARRIIFLTGDVANVETQNFLQSTGNQHLAKPFQLSKVQAAVERALQPPTDAPAPR